MPTSSLIAGVDVGGTKIQTVVVAAEEVKGDHRELTPQSGKTEDVVDAIAGTIRASLEAAGAAAGDLGGVGIGIPGDIDKKAGVVRLAANVPGFSQPVELSKLVSEALDGVSVSLENDVHVGLRGEYERGAGRPYRHVLGCWVGTGVGGALILDGELYEGRGAAGELGHVCVKPDGRHCTCGLHGCLEAYAGRWSMERHARKLHEKGEKTDLFDIMKERGRDRLSSGVYARALKKGDHMAEKLIDEAVEALGVGLGSAQNLLDVEAIIVGGGLGDRLGAPFVERVEQAMSEHLFVRDRPPAVLPTELGDLSGAVGGAVLAGG
jgi:glucokinase